MVERDVADHAAEALAGELRPQRILSGGRVGLAVDDFQDPKPRRRVGERLVRRLWWFGRLGPARVEIYPDRQEALQAAGLEG